MGIRKAIWKSDAQFNAGTPVFDKTEVVGSGDSAYLRLARKSEPTNNVPFTTPGNYIYDPTKTEVSGGVAKLLATVLNDKDWPFITPADYVYDPAKIEVAGGVGKLKGSPITCYAQWHLNETSGLVAADSSGNGRDATCKNTEDSDWVPGKLNNCLRFNEGGTTDEYIDCGNVAGFERTDPFSLEFWIKILGPSGSGITRVLWKYSTVGYLAYIQNSQVVIFLSGGGANRIIVHGDANVQDGNWHHVAITYDGSSDAGGVNIYVDGGLNTLSVDSNALTLSMLTSASLKIADGTVNYFLDGHLDEVVIYDKELNATEVVERWNSGNGSELMPGAFSLDNPPIRPDTGMVFMTNPGQFAETATKPGGTEIKYHINSDDGATWKYWDGSAWIVTDDSYVQANTATDVNANINSLAGSGTFKFRALLHSGDGSATPELDNVYLAEGVSFPVGSFEIEMDFDIHPAMVFNWLSTAETVAVPVGTSLKYQYSINGGSTWNGSWLTEPELEVAAQGISCAGDGSDELRFKFQLATTDVLKTPEIDNLALTYSTGYEDSGTYTSDAYVPVAAWINGVYCEKITFDVTTPTGTTLTVKARTVGHVLEESFVAYNSGDNISRCGGLVQFEATLVTTDNSKTPRLNWCEIEFHTLIGIMRNIDVNTDFVKKMEEGKWELTDLDGGTWIAYEKDNTTEIVRFATYDENDKRTHDPAKIVKRVWIPSP